MTKKVFGWILLIGGLVIIAATLYYSFLIFTGKTQAPEIFKPEDNSATVSDFNPGEIEENLEQAIQEQIRNIVPSEFTTQLFNLISWSIFAGLLILGGGKLSAIGIKMLRKDS